MDVPKPPIPQIGQTKSLVIATTGQRFGNWFIDAIIVEILIAAIAYLPPFVFHDWFLGVGIYFVYMVLLESTLGKTLGKFVTRTKVVMEDGSKPIFSAIIFRTIIRFVPFEVFSILFGSSSGRPTAWHDRWSKTLVVEDK